MLINNAVEVLQSLAPLHLAEKWDNVGLLLGDPSAELKNIITCLTITSAVVDEAIREKADLIVSHHPVLFKPAQRITVESEEGRLLWQLARHGIAVYSPHTAYDNAPDGINDQLAQLLHLNDIKPLVPLTSSSHYKIVVFVPESDMGKVSEALSQAGAGVIGNYQQCSFRVMGTGTFCGTDKATPTIGKPGQLEEVTEYRLEVICGAERIQAALDAIRQAHSYEEPAIDVYPLHGAPSIAHAQVGSGRSGALPASLTPQALAAQLAQSMKHPILLTGMKDRTTIKTVAIVCGAGGSLLQHAIQAGVDAFLTGEIRFHDELAAQAAGITILAAGHYATERPGMEYLAQKLGIALPSCKVWASCDEQNPAQWVPFSAKTSSD